MSYADLGTPIISGLNTNNTVEAFAGALLVALLAAVVAVGLGVLARILTPIPLRRQMQRGLGATARAQAPAVA